LSKARNKGINISRGDILVFLDDDAICFDHYLEDIEKAFTRDESLMVAAGRMMVTNTSLPYRPFDRKHDEVVLSFFTYRYLIGASFVVRREIFDHSHSFDEYSGIGAVLEDATQMDYVRPGGLH
jgi:glycosyltransferase involved in cell wall biosynthesis